MSRLPLTDRTILITRRRSQAGSFRRQLEALGARVLDVPTIEIHPIVSERLDRAIARLEQFDWLIFTSANAVEIFLDRARELRSGAGTVPRICTIGPATARKVKAYGLDVDLVPAVYRAEGILREFAGANGGRIEKLEILLPRAMEAREILPESLSREGARVELVPVYKTVIPADAAEQLEAALRAGAPDLVAFTSSSTARNFVTLARDLAGLDVAELRCAAIGPITAATARALGLKVAVEAETFTVQGLVEAIAGYARESPGG